MRLFFQFSKFILILFSIFVLSCHKKLAVSESGGDGNAEAAPYISTLQNLTTNTNTAVSQTFSMSAKNQNLTCSKRSDGGSIELSSSNNLLIDQEDMSISGSQSACKITLLPNLNQTGTSQVSVRVYNRRGQYSSKSFSLNVISTTADFDNDGFNSPQDCNDSNSTVNPSALEVCDNIDNNCNSLVDENLKSIFYLDADNDNFGSDLQTLACIRPLGYVSNSNDCDDNSASFYPNSPDRLIQEGSQCEQRIFEHCNIDGSISRFESMPSPIVEEKLANNNCSDNIDNDCDQMIDFQESACQQSSQGDYSLVFKKSSQYNFDYTQQTSLPADFGKAEFTMELWIKPDNSYPVGRTALYSSSQLTNWSSLDNRPYSSYDWWWEGNFLLDGHNNNDFSQGTFSLQFYGGGRLRWLYGDGTGTMQSGLYSVQSYPASNGKNLLDGKWHHIALVRKFIGTETFLLMYIDGVAITPYSASTTEPKGVKVGRVNLRSWFDNWSGFPSGQQGWFWGTEKQAAIGVLSQYEDYKGLLDEITYWNYAKSESQIKASMTQKSNLQNLGLMGLYNFDTRPVNQNCNMLTSGSCMIFHNMSDFYSDDSPF